jgi:outer membrane murein-binding lipoprotein Lpp
MFRRKPTNRQLDRSPARRGHLGAVFCGSELETLIERIETMSAAIEALAADVAALEGAETAAVAELAALATEVTELKAGSISEAEVDSLAEKVSAVTNALKAGTEAAE